MASLKGPGEAQTHDGSNLRIAIVHARWNTSIVEQLVKGTTQALEAAGVKAQNIVTQSVPGSWELPMAVQRIYAASQIQSSTTSSLGAAGDLLGVGPASANNSSTNLVDSASSTKPSASSASTSSSSSSPFDAVIAIGVLIKGETMHFEYIAESVSHGLMRVQLDNGVPVVFGLLTVLEEGQALARAGMEGKGHNHGEDWGRAAVEMGVRRRGWGEGKLD
ncbi:MAG: hypothetical protein M1817_004456 [Caeruleum heppii]|nr:MAG: hypothetical protein M1817_004456 [Caeruleum heppii]